MTQNNKASLNLDCHEILIANPAFLEAPSQELGTK